MEINEGQQRRRWQELEKTCHGTVSKAHKTHLCHENTENSRDNKLNSTESASMHTYDCEESLGDATNDDDVSDVLCDVASSQDDCEASTDFKQSRSLD